MQKLKVKIDRDIDFRLFVTVEAFGVEGVVGIRRKKLADGSAQKLTQKEIVVSVTESSTESDCVLPDDTDE